MGTTDNNYDWEHLENGASQWDKRSNCQASRAREAENPQTGTNEAAERGTRIHNYTEYILDEALKIKIRALKKSKGKEVNIPNFKSRVIKLARKNSNGGIPDNAVKDEIDFAWGYTEFVLEKLGNTVLDIQYKIEPKVVLDLELGLGGSIDFLGAYEVEGSKEIIIIDLKTGVRDSNIKQLLQYACAVQEETGWIFDVAHLHVYHPNNLIFDNRFKQESYTKVELVKYAQDFKLIAGKTYDEDAKDHMNVGEWCFFCSAKHDCPANIEHQNKHALSILDSHDNPPTIEEIKAKIPSIPPDTLIGLKRNKELMIKTLNAIDQYFIEQDELGTPVEGIRVVTGSRKRKWSNSVEDVSKDFRENFGVRGTTKKSLKGIGEIEKMLKAKGYDKSQIKDALAEHTELGKAPTVVIYDPDNLDKRPNKIQTDVEKVAALLDEADNIKNE